MEVEFEKYENVYARLKKCFDILFGDGESQKGLMTMIDVIELINSRISEDKKNNLPENSLIERPIDLFEALKETYISRDPSYASGYIGCTETIEEQLDGITNMALLMYLSNRVSKEYKAKANKTDNLEKVKNYKKRENQLLIWKGISISDIIASIYVLSKTSEEYADYFSYGSRTDDENQPSFVIDLPYIGQLCVHFGWEERKNDIVQNAQYSIESILQKKVELGQITEEQLNKIKLDLYKNGVLPEYEGKLYEYVGAMPIEYIGKKVSEIRTFIGNKLPEEITNEDVKKVTDKYKLNKRELYYFFIKMGAPKSVLNSISEVSKSISQKSVEAATDDISMQEFTEATQALKNLAKEREQVKTDPNIR